MRSNQELMNLSGRVALITGGVGHIGMAMAEALSEQGCSIILLDIDRSKLDTAVRHLAGTYGIPAYGLRINLESEEEISTVPDQVRQMTGRLDILINNAGFVGTTQLAGWCVPLAEQTVQTWRRAIEVNMTSIFELTQICMSFLEESPGGSIINVSSIYGVLGPDMSLYPDASMGNPAAYAASKGGLLQLTRYFSTVLAPKIRVNAISPGGIERNQNPIFMQRYIRKVPLNRMGREEDLKGITLFLASDMSAYVTGQNIMIDGGFSAW